MFKFKCGSTAIFVVGMLGFSVAQENDPVGNPEQPEALSISGKVVDYLGNGVGGALVVVDRVIDGTWNMKNDFHGPSKAVLSDDDGSYAITVDYPGRLNWPRASWGNLSTGLPSSTPGNVLQLPKGSPYVKPVWGKVVDREGNPVPNATVHGLGKNHHFKQYGLGDVQGPEETVTADASGQFVLEATNLAVALYAEAGEECSQLMTLPSNRTFDPISLKIDQKFADVLGTVGTRADASAVSGSRVHLLLGSGFGKERSTRTNERGEFAFTRLPPGDAELWAQPRNDGETANWVPVELNGFSRDKETLYLDFVPSVSGRLISPKGKVLADTQVYLAHHDRLFDKTTDSLGWFSFPYRSIGSSKFYIGLDAATWKDEYKRITVNPPQLNLGDVALEPNPRIIGRVVDSAGKPIIANVSRHYDTPGIIDTRNPEVMCDAAGYFNLFVNETILPMEAIEITPPPPPAARQWGNSWPVLYAIASYPFHEKVIPTIPLPSSSDEPLDLGTIVLETREHRQLKGKVIDELGHPAADVVVAMYFGSPDPKRWAPAYVNPYKEISSSSDSAHFVTRSDAKGEWTMDTYLLSEQDEESTAAYQNSFIGALASNGLFGFINSVNWFDSVSLEKEWVIPIIPIQNQTGLSRFAGKVIDNEGNPVPDTAISAFKHAVFHVTTDKDGRFEAYGSGPECRISVWPPAGWFDRSKRQGHTLSSEIDNVITIDRILPQAVRRAAVTPASGENE